MDFRDITPFIAEVAKNYRYHEPPALLVYVQEFITKLRRWIYELLSNLHMAFPKFSANTSMVGNVMEVLLLIAGAIAIILLIYFAWRRMGQLNAQALRARRGEAESETLLDAAGWKTQATELANKSDYRFACRALYLSLLKRLDEKGVLEFIPTRTNYEYWYALSQDRQIALRFRDIANIVESAWFGNHDATAADYEDCYKKLEEAEAAIEESASKTLAAKAAAADRAAEGSRV